MVRARDFESRYPGSSPGVGTTVYKSMPQTPTWSDNSLTEAVSSSTGVTEVVRKLYGSWCGGSSQLVVKRIKSLGLGTSHFTRRVPRVPRNQPDTYFLCNGRDLSSKKVRALLLKYKPYECSLCGNSGSHNGLKLTLHVDHKDGVRSNNELENLRWLCPNCHSQTETYASKNIKTRDRKVVVLVTLFCKCCAKEFKVEKRVMDLKIESGQSSFFCSVLCSNLSRRQATDEQILVLMGERVSNPDIARRLGMSTSAVCNRVSKIRSRTTGSSATH